MADLVNALVAVVAVTVALTRTSLDRPVAMLLGLTGGLTGNFLAWLVAPGAWEHSAVLPWVVSVVGTVAVIAGWSATRAYSGLFRTSEPVGTDTAGIRDLSPAGVPDR